MWSLVVNLIGIEAGGLLGLGVKKLISDRQITSLTLIANLCIAVIGIQGAVRIENAMLMTVSAAVGSLIGVALDIDGRFRNLGKRLQKLFNHTNDHFSRGFVSLFMIQAIGSMAIVGPMDAALSGNTDILMLKAVLDFTSSLVYASIYGPGVLLSGPFVFAYQALIYVLAGQVAPVLTEVVIHEVSAIGSLLIFALSLDLLGILKLKVANYLPAMLGPVVYHFILLAFSR